MRSRRNQKKFGRLVLGQTGTGLETSVQAQEVPAIGTGTQELFQAEAEIIGGLGRTYGGTNRSRITQRLFESPSNAGNPNIVFTPLSPANDWVNRFVESDDTAELGRPVDLTQRVTGFRSARHRVVASRSGVARLGVQPGECFGRYKVSELLGAGGMGEVYEARDPLLGRAVALKILPAHLANDQPSRCRFEREALAGASVNHPNVVSILDCGVSAGRPYLVMELVRGTTVRQLLAPGPLQPSCSMDIAVEICEGLAAIHDAGYLHRDIKPSNIMVSDSGRVKILDFGLALPASSGPSQSPFPQAADVTAPGRPVGTVEYMSPEQARGQCLDQRTDQFSFGVLVYELASGRNPFARGSVAETLSAILYEEPKPLPPSPTILPARLGALLGRCMEKRPQDRFRSTRELLDGLRLCVREAA